MKKWFGNNRAYLIGALVGAIAGFLYWRFIGCASGACAISSSIYSSTLYFAFSGALIGGTFKKEKVKEDPGVK